MQRKGADYFMLLLKNDYRDLKVDHFYITKVLRDPKKCQKFPIMYLRARSIHGVYLENF